jgi:hypothetical protein
MALVHSHISTAWGILDPFSSKHLDYIVIDRYSWEHLFEEKFSTHYGYVTSLQKLDELLHKYDIASSTRFRCFKSTKNFGKPFREYLK